MKNITKIESRCHGKIAITPISTKNDNYIIEAFTFKSYQKEIMTEFKLYKIEIENNQIRILELCKQLATIKHEATKRLTENKIKKFHNEALNSFNIKEFDNELDNYLNN